jgi:hypothetical protein
MQDAMIPYARSQRDDAGLLRRLWRRLAVWSPATRRGCGHDERLVVSAEEFERVQQCLSTPPKPSAGAQAGAEILRNLPNPNR